MVEPSRSDAVKRLSSIGMTASSSVGPREEPAELECTLQGAPADHPRVVLLPGDGGIGKTRRLQERRSGTLCYGLQVGYGCRSEDLPPPYPPFIEVLQALRDQLSLEIEHTISSNLQDQAELHYGADLAHDPEPIWSSRLAGNIRRLSEVFVVRTGTSSTVASVPLDTLVDLQPPHRSNTEFPPVVQCARS